MKKLGSSSNQLSIEHEKEQAQLQIENEELKKQLKEFQNKLTQSRTDTREVEQLKSKIAKLEDSLQKYDQELAQAKYGWASIELEKETVTEQLKLSQTKIVDLTQQANKMEEQVLYPRRIWLKH